MRIHSRWLVLVAPLVLAGHALSADKLPPQFTLGRYVPADAWLYIHGVDNPERHWIDERWAKVIQTVADSGVDQDLANLIFPLIPEAQRQAARDGLDRIVKAVKTVKWTDLPRHEFAFAERISTGGLSYDYLMLFRGDSAEHNYKALADILKEVAGLSDELGVQSLDTDGINVLALGGRNPDAEKLSKPVFWLLRKDDIIGAVLSPPVGDRDRTITDDVIGMMSGKKPVPSIADSPRFRKALAHIEAPADQVSFFDLKMMFGNMRGMFDTISRRVDKGDDKGHAAVGTMAKLVRLADVVDYTVSSTGTKGRRCLSDEYTQFQPDKKDEPVARLVLGRKPFEHFDKYIPQSATSFSLSAGIDIESLYNLLTGFVKDNLSDGPQALDKLNGLFAQIGFDPQRDLFSWWSGEMIQLSMPATVVTPMGGGSDWALMVRVKNPEVASCRVNAAIDWVNKKLQQRGQMLMVSPAKCGSGSFREVTHPMLAMIARPVIGVQDNWLVIAKSASTVDKCMAVAKGDAPSIMKNERFRDEGLVPGGPVQCMSFEDLSGRGQEWAGKAAAAGMMGGVAASMLPAEVPQETRQLIQNLTGIVAKLAPALQQIDFYSSRASRGTREGDSALRKQTVVTYKLPAPHKDAEREAAAKAK
jgi:hypothetical protein